MSLAARLFPWLVVATCILWLASKLILPSNPADQMHLHNFGQIPVVYEGRIKPLDTLARNTLRILSGRQTIELDDGHKLPAIQWLLHAISDTDTNQRVFRIEHPDLLRTLGLQRRPGLRYAVSELDPDGLVKIAAAADQADRRKPTERDVYDNKVLEFFLNRYLLRRRIVFACRFPEIGSPDEFFAAAEEYRYLSRFSLPHLTPPNGPDAAWKPLILSRLESIHRQPDPSARMLASILFAYGQDDVQSFNRTVSEYRNLIEKEQANGINFTKIKFEYFFNHFAPFQRCAVLYLIAFILATLGWLFWTKPLNRTAWMLILLTLIIHSFALVARMSISGRPPVTNLYSSAVFVGWGCVLLGLILEWIYRLGIGSVVASVAGFLTLLIAHFLAGDGDTFRVLQAVLDTQFWLATHVVCITLGYATTYLAGLLAILFILRGTLTSSLKPKLSADLTRMIYGTICFAMFFSFVGTVLGGLWADDSWGRFWGWDPKENGALIIVLWNALLLHARWGGLVHHRGLAVLAVFGNVVTSWSWFGVNQLGIGLHSYGFIESTSFWLAAFVFVQILVMIIGSLPPSLWRSKLT